MQKAQRHERRITLLPDMARPPQSTYYDDIRHMKDEDGYGEMKEQIADIFKENEGRYGYQRITMEIRNRGYGISYKTVLRLTHEEKPRCEVCIKAMPHK